MGEDPQCGFKKDRSKINKSNAISQGQIKTTFFTEKKVQKKNKNRSGKKVVRPG